MLITACVKNWRTKILPQNRCLVALLFKDGGGLANHPLSCHPQGVFGSRENKRKGKKMGEKESSGKTPAQNFITAKKSLLVIVCTNGLYSHQDKQNYQIT